MNNPWTDTNIGFHFIWRTLGVMLCFSVGALIGMYLK